MVEGRIVFIKNLVSWVVLFLGRAPGFVGWRGR